MPTIAAVAADLLPHGICLSWRPDLILLHAVADVVTAIAYYSIPLMLLFFVHRRRDLQFRWMFVLFGVFIMACGATHVMSLWTLWHPDYLAQGIVKAVTALASVGTAVILYPLIPKALALPGPAQWEAVHRELRGEVAERREAESEVRRLNAELEARVRQRTAELEAANRDLREREASLRQNQALLRSIIDHSTAVIFVKDLEGRYLLINRRYSELFHVSVDGIAGLTDHDLFPRERADAFRAVDRQVLAAGGTLQAEEVVPQDDGLHTYLSLKYPLVDDSGAPYAICGIATDISERQARQAAEAASKAKSDFLATMSHELRTPLNAILGYAQILQRDSGLSPRQSGGLQTIEQSGQHLLTLINDLLDLAKIEAGKFELHPEPVHLASTIAVVADIIRVRVEQKKLAFAYAPAALPGCVFADDKRLRQVLLNLLSNAAKFTDHGSVALDIDVLAEDANEVSLRFAVRDTGVGIAADQLDAIFQPFEQVGDRHRRSGGTGLGLAISRQLVRLMGSELQVDSRPGQGSRFWFDLRLPRLAAALAPAPEQRLPCGYEGARKKILIADDVAGNRALLTDLLGGLGFEITEAANGQEAVDLARACAPDLLLTDLVMPLLDGIAATRLLRATPGLERLPIVIVSASAKHDDPARALAAGVDAFLPKPIEQGRLVERIGTLLGITWRYPARPPAEVSPPTAEPPLPPPVEELQILHGLARAGDMRDIRRHAARLRDRDPRYAPFAEAVERLAQAYQSKALLALVEECLEGGQA